MDMNELEKFIDSRLESEFMKKLFIATLLQPKYEENPIKYNSFAFSFRELVRHVFYHLAPNDDVKSCIWYIYNEDVINGITRAQRIEYAIRGGLSNSFLNDKLGINLKKLTKEILKSIDVLNKYTHIEEDIFSVAESEGDKIVRNSIQALMDFFKAIENLKDNLIGKYEHLLFDIIDEIFNDETFDEIDILSTHHLIDEIILDKIEIVDIDSSEISIKVMGTVCVLHQYGSDRDVSKGDGAEFYNSYPFIVSKKIDVSEPLQILIDPNEIMVDNSNFFE